MLVGLAWEGRCLPLVWRTYIANDSQTYPTDGQAGLIQQLLETVKAGIGDHVMVLVLADRGIGCSPDLCRVVDGLGWHYLFRVTCQTKVDTSQGASALPSKSNPARSGRSRVSSSRKGGVFRLTPVRFGAWVMMNPGHW